MGTASSMLTQYDIEEVQEHCNNLFSQQEIVSLYQRFCQLDRNAKGFISADEFLSVPEFAMNPLSQRLLKMADGLNFKDFVAFLSAFSAKASAQQKIERSNPGLKDFSTYVESSEFLLMYFRELINNKFFTVIFKVYDSDRNGKVSFKDMLEVLKDLSGSFMSDDQREEVLSQVLREAGYTKDSYLTLDDFIKVLGQSDLKMDVEVPVD
ncbi:Calcineurin subunit B [Glycine max]|nr:Calcineurin subunit B [Glycine max]